MKGSLLYSMLIKNVSKQDAIWFCAKQQQQAVREAATIHPAPCKLTFDLVSGARVTCDVGYLCANFSLPRPLCSRLRPDVRDRQTDVRRTSSLNAPYPRGGGINRCAITESHLMEKIHMHGCISYCPFCAAYFIGIIKRNLQSFWRCVGKVQMFSFEAAAVPLC